MRSLYPQKDYFPGLEILKLAYKSDWYDICLEFENDLKFNSSEAFKGKNVSLGT